MAHSPGWRAVASALAAAALLAACGGGDSSPTTTRIVSFGDSLSDLGSYTPATSLTATPGAAPYFGGKFTTNTFSDYALPAAGTARAPNTSTATTWVEWVAARVGVSITPHQVGFGPQSVICPAATSVPALAGSCTGYGQGGSRVTDPNGINKAAGALTVPIVTQVANHLTRFSNFQSTDIVFMLAGANDLLIQFGAAGQGLPPATAIANMQTAGTQLAAIVKDQIVAKGATRVAVMTLPNIAPFPAFNQLPAANTALLAQLATAFNTAVAAGLVGVDVRYIDNQIFFSDIVANPAKYGFTNITTAACDPAKISVVTRGLVTDGSALFCNASAGVPFNGLKAGASASTWLFADGVHPTTGTHKVWADYVIAQLKEFGWIPINQ